jgi:hypothetical protein
VVLGWFSGAGQEVYDDHLGRHSQKTLSNPHQPLLGLALHRQGFLISHLGEYPGPPLILVEEFQVPAVNFFPERCHGRNLRS